MDPRSWPANIGKLMLHGIAHKISLAMRDRCVQAPKAEAATILQRRFPVPRLVDCDQNGSQVCSCQLAAASLLKVFNGMMKWQCAAPAL